MMKFSFCLTFLWLLTAAVFGQSAPGSSVSGQRSPHEFWVSSGAPVFVEADPHWAIGASARLYLTRRLSLQPEFLYARASAADQDLLLLPNVAYDLTEPNQRVVPYVIAGAGLLLHRDSLRLPTTSWVNWGKSWTAGAGVGAKIFLSDRWFFSPVRDLPRERKPCSLQCSDGLGCGDPRKFPAHTAASREVKLTDSDWGISSPASRRSSSWRRIASLIFSSAYMAPCA